MLIALFRCFWLLWLTLLVWFLDIVLLRGLVSVACCFRVCWIFDVLGVVYGGWFNC